METHIEKLIKLTLLLIIILAGLSYWLIPKSKLRSKFQMNENVFIITQSIGILCGVAGIVYFFYLSPIYNRVARVGTINTYLIS